MRWEPKPENGGTIIYGASDDLIECEGEFTDEWYANESGNHVTASDGTVLHIIYGKAGIWRIAVIKAGPLFARLDAMPADADGDGDRYTDVAYFAAGLESITVGKLARKAKARE
jgi:hypothetical protein